MMVSSRNLLMVIATLLLFYASVAASDVDGGIKINDAPTIGLRGVNNFNARHSTNKDIDNNTQDMHFLRQTSLRRSLRKEQDTLLVSHKEQQRNREIRSLYTDDSSVIVLTQPLSFQITMSIILGIIAIGQIALYMSFYLNQSKRALEFAQPIYVCMFIASGLITTGACYLYIYITNVGCIIREPIIFISLSLMGAIVAGRAWRISTLMNNPLMSAGRGGDNESGPSRVERIRQFTMVAISALSGCDYSAFNLPRRPATSGGRPIRVQINFMQMMKAILLLCIPQIILQAIVMGVPALRYTKVLSSSSISYSETFTGTIGQYQCQSSTAASYAVYVFSVIFVLLPFMCAYLLNIRPQVEMEKLPQIIDERFKIKRALMVTFRLVVTNLPIIGMTYYYQSPAIRAYAAIVTMLGLPLFLNYYVAYIKLAALKSSNMPQIGGTFGSSAVGGGGGNVTGRGSAAYAVKMAEMYSKIGRTEETLELIDETLDVWKEKAKEGGGFQLGDQRRYKETIGAGFTQQDLDKLGPEELEMVLQLLQIKGDALMKLHGFAAFPLSAELNINSMRIFEACPAHKKLKDISIMFPIYNRVGIQLKGGVINQDDTCNLESDLYSRFYHEAQVQSFHLVRALGALAEWYGRIGQVDKAFQYFKTMTSIYMPNEHAPLLSQNYSVNRCAITYAVSALWFLQRGQPKQAIERCDQVIAEILPSHDTKDLVGMYHIIWPIIRVLKWNGEVDKARDFYDKWAPDGIEKHFSLGVIHKPMCLLLKICDGNPDGKYETDDMYADIDMVLEFDAPDMTDLNFITDGWSVKSMAAELCLHLARRLDAGSIPRRDLIDRGIQMSTMANERNTTADGLIKHILAHEAHKGIDDRLLELRREDNAVHVDVIYDKDKTKKPASRGSLGFAVASNGVGNNNVSFDFARKFTVKGSGSSSGGLNRSSKSSYTGILKKSSRSRGGSSHHSKSSNESMGSTGKHLLSSRSKNSHVSMNSRHSRRASDCESIAEVDVEVLKASTHID